MPVDAAQFKHALSQFASGVTVVTTRDAAGKPMGLTVSAFCSVSLDPPLVLVSIAGESETHRGFRESGRFAVSILAEGQSDVSRRFSWMEDRFAGLSTEVGATDAIVIPGAVAQLECTVRAAHPAGDHVLYVGEVDRVAVQPGRPLLYHRGAYRLLEAEEE
jgi:flavin reductase (DIM6/NTAB) family NADH-FMN oxidoreductase RutF